MESTPPFYDDLIAAQNRRLFRLALGNGAVAMLLLMTVALLAVRSAPPPYVITVNRQGEIIGPARPVYDPEQLGDSVVRYALIQIFRNAFTFGDNHDQNVRQVMGGAYAFTSHHVAEVLNAFYLNPDGSNDLRVLEHKAFQDVEFPHPPLKLPAADTWQVDFQTVRHYYQDSKIEVVNHAAIVKVEMGKPTRNNQLGLYVTALDIQSQ